jgi:hypothetical protein
MRDNGDRPHVTGPQDLANAGVRFHRGTDPLSRGRDPLERYLNIPNHAIVLFTSEDRLIDSYLRDHWAALDGLSGDTCDIHVSILQLNRDEDAYCQRKELKSIPGLSAFQSSDLPALHIWSREASVTVPLGKFNEEVRLKNVLRAIFALMQKAGGPITMGTINELRSVIARELSERDNQPTGFHQEVYLDAKYKILGGNQGSIGDNANAHDFTQIWNAAANKVDLAELSKELATFRGQVSNFASEPEHFSAAGEVNEAQKAAQNGDGPGALAHLKQAGSWIWDVATKVGIGLATAAAKSAIGL